MWGYLLLLLGFLRLSLPPYRPPKKRNNVYLFSWCWQKAEQCSAPRRCFINIVESSNLNASLCGWCGRGMCLHSNKQDSTSTNSTQDRAVRTLGCGETGPYWPPPVERGLGGWFLVFPQLTACSRPQISDLGGCLSGSWCLLKLLFKVDLRDTGNHPLHAVMLVSQPHFTDEDRQGNLYYSWLVQSPFIQQETAWLSKNNSWIKPTDDSNQELIPTNGMITQVRAEPPLGSLDSFLSVIRSNWQLYTTLGTRTEVSAWMLPVYQSWRQFWKSIKN